MAPTASDYAHGLRRLWWVPLITVLVGLGLGLWASSDVRPTAVTTGNALFTFRIADPGDDSAGSARGAEAEVAQSRLAGYVQIARSSQAVQATLRAAGTEEPPTALNPTGGFKQGSANALIDVAGATGLVEIRVKNGDLSQAEATRLVQELAREVVRQAVALDTQQVTPSLQPDALITEPQATEEPASRVMKLALPVLLLLTVGLGLVYLLVWRQGRIYGRRDIEERLGARVLGDLRGGAADAPAIALALGKGREGGTTALLVPADRVPSGAVAGLGESVAAAGRGVGLRVTHTPVAGRVAQASVAQAVALDPAGPSESRSGTLTLLDAPAGLDGQSLRAAASVDIVALIVEYGTTSYRDLTTAGQTLAEATTAEIAVIGVHPSAKP